MTEVSSMSENEGRPSSLPPPPSERLPDLPAIFISDTEALPHKKGITKKPKRKHNTVSGVTQEARKVLEHLLKRSLSSNDANPAQSDSSGGGLPEHPPPPHHYPTQPHHLPRADSYRHKITEKLLLEKMEQLELSLSESQDMDEPDYVYPHEIVRKTLSISSRGSSAKLPSSSSRSHSPSEKALHSVQPLPIRTPHSGGRNKHYCKKYHRDQDEEEGESSTSTEDYEYTDPNEFLRRKKKSFFRRATERLMHSFRRRKEHPLDFGDFDSLNVDLSPSHKSKKKKKGGRLSSPFKSLSRKGSSKEAPSVKSPVTYGDILNLQDSMCMHQEVLRTEASSPDNATHYTDIEQFHEESLRRKCQSPLPWKKSRMKEGHLSDGGRDRGLLDSFIRQIKKRGSFKIKRKDNSKAQQRCQSADNLISVRPLNKEQEKLLQHYAHTKTHGTGSDSEILAVTSLHEVLAQRIEQQISPKQTPPSPLTWEEQQLFRDGMRLEGLTSLSELKPTLEEPDYDEIEDDVDGLFPSFFSAGLPKPFSERTDKEKEVVYEKIAGQLAAIADHYNMGSPRSQKNSPTEPFPPELLESSGSSELEGATAVKKSSHSLFSSSGKRKSKSSSDDDKTHLLREPSELEKELALLLRDRGDTADISLADLSPAVKEMVRNASYGRFKQIVNENIGSKPGWQQIAMMFRLTQTAVSLAGMGTAVALQIKENTMLYFEDQFASWIIKQGGWESMVEDTNSELD